MASKKIQKTNAMRILDRNKIPYEAEDYDYDEEDLSGVHAAEVTGIPAEEMFKTLVTRSQGSSKGTREDEYFVFVIPVAETLDLKKGAKTAGRKKIEMIHVKEIENITGYIRGGCSPVGMKKAFPTFLDESAATHEKIYVSAGKRGVQIRVRPEDILAVTGGSLADLTE